MGTEDKDHYSTVGANYANLDPFKVRCQAAGAETIHALDRLGLRGVSDSIGESCSLIESGEVYLGPVMEGLGTKNLVAQAMQDLTGEAHWWYGIGQDALAMILNDVICSGARPATVLMYAAVGNDTWFEPDTKLKLQRMEALIAGWRDGCIKCECAWIGGETPCLKGVIVDGAIDLAGSGVGIIRPKSDKLSGSKIGVGDGIVLVRSFGIMSNGISGARDVATKLPQGYLTRCGRSTFGAEILTPTLLYAPLVEALLDNQVGLVYATHISGHGWKKLMRADVPLEYVIDRIPTPDPIFRMIQQVQGLSNEEMYRTYNMGAGFGLIVKRSGIMQTIHLAHELGFEAWFAGDVIDSMDESKRVHIKPLDITYEDLGVR